MDYTQILKIFLLMALINQDVIAKPLSLSELRQEAENSVIAGDFTQLESINHSLLAQSSVLPKWALIKLKQSVAIPKEQQAIAKQWSEKKHQASVLLRSNKLHEAIELMLEAESLAHLELGDKHLTRFLSLKFLAELYLHSENITQAHDYFFQSWELAKAILGTNHPTTLSVGLQWVKLSQQQGQTKQTNIVITSLYQESLEVLGAAHPQTLDIFLVLLSAMPEENKNKKFILLCQDYKKLLGSLHTKTGHCFYKLALSYKDQALLAKAKNSLSQAEKGFTEINISSISQLMEITIEKAELLRLQGQINQAEKKLLKLLDELKKNNDSHQDLNRLRVQAYLARIYNDKGDYKQAEQLLSDTLESQHQLLGVNHPETLSTLVDFAHNAQNLGHYNIARHRFSEALEAYKKIMGDKHPATLAAYNNLGLLLEQMGLFDDSALLLKSALNTAINTLGKTHPQTIALNNNLALLSESQGLFSEAKIRYQETLTIVKEHFGKQHTYTLALMNNLAYLNMLDENYADATKIFQKLYTVWDDKLGKNHPNTLKVLNNLGRSEYYLKDYSKAELHLEKALKLRQEKLGQRHPSTLRSKIDYSLLLLKIGRETRAEKLMQTALKDTEDLLGKQHPLFFEALNGLADIIEKKGAYNKSHNLRRRGFNLRTDFLSKMLWVSGDNTRAAYIKLFKPELNAYLNSLSLINEKQAGKDLIEISMQRKGFLLHTTAKIKQIFRLAKTPKLSQMVADLTQYQKDLTRLILLGTDESGSLSHLQSISDLQEKINYLMTKLAESETQLSQSIIEPSINDLIDALPNNTALVDFFIKDEQEQEESELLVGILLKRNEQVDTKFFNLGHLSIINKSILELRSSILSSISKGGKTTWIKSRAIKAYRAIWQPLESYLIDSKDIFIVADGILNILPFDVLMNTKGKYLLDQVNLHLVNSNQDLVLNKQAKSKGNLLIFSGPYFDTQGITKLQEKELITHAPKLKRGQTEPSLQAQQQQVLRNGLSFISRNMRSLNFKKLTGAEQEGQVIYQIALESGMPTIIKEKEQAQELILNNLVKQPKFLHIATHGFFLKEDDDLRKRLLKIERSHEFSQPIPGDNPLLRSGLVFAGFNDNAVKLGHIDTENDGILTALEILSLNLQGTEMVVLSACETGLGEIHEGEGVYGLRRSFQEAGARSVVASLWSVSDEATAVFMRYLYQGIFQGNSVRQSFINAQRELRHSEKWKHPFFWSSFNLT